MGDLVLIIPHFDLKVSSAWRRLHLCRDRMVAITGQAVHNRPHHEMGAKLLAQTIEFVDVALSVSYMDATFGTAKQVDRLT